MRSFEYLRTSPMRNMPWIKRGMRCEINGKRGVVTSGGPSGNVSIRFDGEKFSKPCHPHWQAVYYNPDGTIIKDYRQEA